MYIITRCTAICIKNSQLSHHLVTSQIKEIAAMKLYMVLQVLTDKVIVFEPVYMQGIASFDPSCHQHQLHIGDGPETVLF